MELIHGDIACRSRGDRVNPVIDLVAPETIFMIRRTVRHTNPRPGCPSGRGSSLLNLHPYTLLGDNIRLLLTRKCHEPTLVCVLFCRSPRVPSWQGPHDRGAAYPAVGELRGVPVRRDQSESCRATVQLGCAAANAV